MSKLVETLVNELKINDEFFKSDFDMVKQTTLDMINTSEDKDNLTNQLEELCNAVTNKYNFDDNHPLTSYIAKCIELNLDKKQINAIVKMYTSPEFTKFHEIIEQCLVDYSEEFVAILDLPYGFEESPRKKLN